MKNEAPIRFAAPAAVLARAFVHLAVPDRLSVVDAALKYRVLENTGGGYSGPWSFDDGPYLRRPMECLSPDNGYSTVAVQGPGQCGKSDIGNNWMLQTGVCDPANMMMLAPDKNVLSDYIVSEIDKMLRLTPALRQRLLDTSSADNRFIKQFVGSTWFFVWPVKSQLRMRAVPRARVDDYDAIPEDIDGEGNALSLLGIRQTTFEGFEKTYVNSSPALGEDRGIEAVVAAGTDERWVVRCLHCSAPFILDFDACFKWDNTGTPEQARASACVVCPTCGGVHEPRAKRQLMATGAWVGAGQVMLADGSIQGKLRPSATASFRIDGLMGFSSWALLAQLVREAEIEFEKIGDEFKLRTFYNGRIGKNYASRLEQAQEIDVDGLKERALQGGYSLGEVPAGVVCLTAAVDVQSNRFAVTVLGWGQGLESWLIDRFDILQLEDGRTRIDPARHPEHWGVLVRKVLWRTYPTQEDPAVMLSIVNTGIDTGGIEGVTDNAFQFWFAAMRLGVPATSITLIKGGNNPKARLLPPPTVDADRGRRNGKKQGEPDAEFFVPNVHRIKDMVDARLRRPQPGPLYCNFPVDIDPAYLDEITAEHKVRGLWEKKQGRANETLDGYVYNIAALTRHAGNDTSLAWVPEWARPRRRGDAPAAAIAATPDLSPPAPVKRAIIPRRFRRVGAR